MAKKKSHPKTVPDKPLFHKDLKGFEIKVNSFGEMESNFEISKLNAFLDEHVEDKKLGNEIPDEEE
jgi:hypothetical protein